MKHIVTCSAVLFFGFAAAGLAQQPQNLNANPPSAHAGVESVIFSPDGKLLLTNSPGATIQIWDAATGKPLSPSPAHFGTWQLRSFKYGDATEWSNLPETQRRIKHITEAHFIWVQYETDSGKVQTGAGGTYTFSDGAYTESLVYAGEGMTEYLGKKQPFTIRVEGDKLYQSGRLSDGTKIEEIWQRVKRLASTVESQGRNP